MGTSITKTKERIKAAFDKWLKPLGLLWWDIEVTYHTDPEEIVRTFRDPGQGGVVAARTITRWQYGSAYIDINVTAFTDLTDKDIERIVVHECCHVLVNELTEESEDHHEERVVTNLTKAFMWVGDLL